MRAAYWTARSLQLLREQVPDFDRRTLMLSGVSGGAVGEAIYRACDGAAACIDRFGRADLLTQAQPRFPIGNAIVRWRRGLLIPI